MLVYKGPVCPLPRVLRGSRHLGDVNTVTCQPHEYGGGTATCREDRTWSAKIQPCARIMPRYFVPFIFVFKFKVEYDLSFYQIVCKSHLLICLKMSYYLMLLRL